jgi:transposase-like protein
MPEYRTFDEDLKAGAVRSVEETGKPNAQVARDLDVREGTLGNRGGEGAAGTRGRREDEPAGAGAAAPGGHRDADAARRPQTLRGPQGDRGDGPVAVDGFIASGEGTA